MTPCATPEYHGYEQLDLFDAFDASVSLAPDLAPDRVTAGSSGGCRCRRRPDAPLPMEAELELIILGAMPRGLVERYAWQLETPEETNLLGRISRQTLSSLVCVYKARLYRHAQGNGMSLIHGGEHVTPMLDEDGAVVNIVITLLDEKILSSTQRIAAELQDAVDRSGVELVETLSEWLLVGAALKGFDDESPVHWENEHELRNRIKAAMFEQVTSPQGVSTEDLEEFSCAVANIYLEACGIEHMRGNKLEEIIGLRDNSDIRPARVPEPREDHLITPSAVICNQLRNVLGRRNFRKDESTIYPHTDISHHGSRGYTLRGFARMLPPGHEEGRITPDQAQAWAGLMQQQANELSDLDADVLDTLWISWLHQSRGDKRYSATLKIDDILRMRGVKEKLSGDGRRGGYMPKQRKDVIDCLHRLEAIWIDVGEMNVWEDTDNSGHKKNNSLSFQSRAIAITDRAGLKTDKDMDVSYVKYQPGMEFARILTGSGRQVAWLSMAALSYDYVKEIVPKRLAKYLAMQFKINARKGCFKALRVSTLIEAIGVDSHASRPLRLRERLEKGLDRLHADGVIAGWQYGTVVDRMAISRKRWLDSWLNSLVEIEPPEAIKDFYIKYAKGGGQRSSKMGIVAAPDPVAMLAAMQPPPISANVRARRKALGLTQARLSEITGVNKSVISLVENGRTKTLPTACKTLRKWLDETADSQDTASAGN